MSGVGVKKQRDDLNSVVLEGIVENISEYAYGEKIIRLISTTKGKSLDVPVYVSCAQSETYGAKMKVGARISAVGSLYRDDEIILMAEHIEFR